MMSGKRAKAIKQAVFQMVNAGVVDKAQAKSAARRIRRNYSRNSL